MYASFFAVAALAASVLSPAQTDEALAPKTPALAPAARDPDRLILSELKGLAFAPAKEAGASPAGLTIADLPLLETAEFRALVTPYLGRALTRGALDGLTREVVLYCRRHHRPVVDVFVPEQDISAGSVQVLVVEGRLGAVRTEGNRWFTDDQLAPAVRTRPGEVIVGDELLADLAWINRNPFRQTDLVFSRGRQPGETDVVLRTLDRRPLRVFAGYEDTGNALTGYERVFAGLNWGNAFGRDEQLNYQFTASPDFQHLTAHAGSYVMALPWRHTLALSGSYARSEPELAGGDFDLRGRTWQLSARYRLPLGATGPWTRELTAGVDFKRSNNNLAFGGMEVFDQQNDVVQASATLHAGRADRRGRTDGALSLCFSPGGLSAGNHLSAYEAARAGARPDYSYARLELERTTRLPGGFTWLVRGTAQYASANLLGSEQLGLGGADRLRGYEEREANGDDGVVVVNELRTPPLRLARLLGRGSADDRLEGLAFFDSGVVASHDRLPDEAGSLTLASAGVGLRYRLGTMFNVQADYGWQLKDSGVSDGRRSSRLHLAASLAY